MKISKKISDTAIMEVEAYEWKKKNLKTVKMLWILSRKQ